MWDLERVCIADGLLVEGVESLSEAVVGGTHGAVSTPEHTSSK